MESSDLKAGRTVDEIVYALARQENKVKDRPWDDTDTKKLRDAIEKIPEKDIDPDQIDILLSVLRDKGGKKAKDFPRLNRDLQQRLLRRWDMEDDVEDEPEDVSDDGSLEELLYNNEKDLLGLSDSDDDE